MFAALVLVAVLPGCTPGDAPEPDVSVTWRVSPNPPDVGPSTVRVQLADSAGRPLEGANVRVEGVMTHPGMAPVMARAAEISPGIYEADLEFTMAGDWVVLLDATLSDGRDVHRRYELPNVRAQ